MAAAWAGALSQSPIAAAILALAALCTGLLLRAVARRRALPTAIEDRLLPLRASRVATFACCAALQAGVVGLRVVEGRQQQQQQRGGAAEEDASARPFWAEPAFVQEAAMLATWLVQVVSCVCVYAQRALGQHVHTSTTWSVRSHGHRTHARRRAHLRVAPFPRQLCV